MNRHMVPSLVPFPCSPHKLLRHFAGFFTLHLWVRTLNQKYYIYFVALLAFKFPKLNYLYAYSSKATIICITLKPIWTLCYVISIFIPNFPRIPTSLSYRLHKFHYPEHCKSIYRYSFPRRQCIAALRPKLYIIGL